MAVKFDRFALKFDRWSGLQQRLRAWSSDWSVPIDPEKVERLRQIVLPRCQSLYANLAARRSNWRAVLEQDAAALRGGVRQMFGSIDFGAAAQRLAVAGVGAVCLFAVAATAVSQFAHRDEDLVSPERSRADALMRHLSEAEIRHAREMAVERHNSADAQRKYAAELAAIERQRGLADAQRAAELAAVEKQRSQAAAQHAAELAALERQRSLAVAQYGAELGAVRRQMAENESKHVRALAVAQRQLAELRDQAAKTDRDLAAANQALNQANETLEQVNLALNQANATIADFKAQQTQRRLSYEEKRALIAALRFHLGHKVRVVATFGDDDAKTYAEDLAQVLDAAGWKLDTKEPIIFRRWDRSPVGVEVTLNEADARAGRLSAGMGALINAVRKLGLADGNTVFMNSDVPSGEVELRVGRRLRGDAAPALRAGPGPGATPVQ